jgi:hypothetical protein
MQTLPRSLRKFMIFKALASSGRKRSQDTTQRLQLNTI